MSLQSVLRLAFDDRGGWDDLHCCTFPLARLLVGIAFPLSLLPPVMVYVAGTYAGDALFPAFHVEAWYPAALAFVSIEWLTVLGMARAIRLVAAANGIACTDRDASLLALLAPIPLWLSALALAIPSWTVTGAAAGTGLLLACGVTYHGIRSLSPGRDEAAAAATFGVVAIGLAAWALLLVLVVPA